jgi:twitching motility protein PilT
MSELGYALPQLLKALLEEKGSDLHISPGSPPRFRVNGSLVPLNLTSMTAADTKSLVYSVLTEKQKKAFEERMELDFALSLKGVARFRVNIYTQKAAVSGVFRLISTQIPTLSSLSLPKKIVDLIKSPRGLFLVCGPTGSGKTTSLAAMINHINESRHSHILTIEDPVEYVHDHKNCLVNQREVGSDTHSFSSALRSALREDPDIILVGEMRDPETIALAITAAETGHLVLGTLHTNSCVGALNRIVDVFPPHQQSQIRTQLSFSLVGVMTQQLISSLKGGRVLATELLIPNVAIRSNIREDKLQAIYYSMQSGQEQTGMSTLNQSLVDLVKRKLITVEQAFDTCYERNELEDLISKMLIANGGTGIRR